MVNVFWNNEKEEVAIEWTEKKAKNETPVYHSFNKKPIRLQLHPVTKSVIRAHFKGARPGWIVRFTLANGYHSTEVVTDDGPGWWIANWRNHENRPLSSPNIRGMIHEWCSKVSEDFNEEKMLVLDNLDFVEANLLYNYSAFNKYGLHFLPELIVGETGSMVLEDIAVPIDEEDCKANRANHSNYFELLEALIQVCAIPEKQEVITDFEEADDEFVIDLSDSNFEEEEISVESQEFFEEETISIDEEILILEEEPLEFDQIEEEVLPLVVRQDLKLDEKLEAKEKLELASSNESDMALNQNADTLIIAEKNNKKENIIAGQILLF